MFQQKLKLQDERRKNEIKTLEKSQALQNLKIEDEFRVTEEDWFNFKDDG